MGHFSTVPVSLGNITLRRKWNQSLSSAVVRHPNTSSLNSRLQKRQVDALWPSTPRTRNYRVWGSLPSGEMNPIGFLNNSMPSAAGLTSGYSSRVTCLLQGSKITLITAGLGIRLLVRGPALSTECESNDHDLLNPMLQNTWHRPWPSADAQKVCSAGWNFGRAPCFSLLNPVGLAWFAKYKTFHIGKPGSDFGDWL